MSGSASVRKFRTAAAPSIVCRGWDDRRAQAAVVDALRPEIARLKCPHLVLADALGVGDATAESYWYAKRAMKLRELMALSDVFPELPGRLFGAQAEDPRAELLRLLEAFSADLRGGRP